MTEHGHISSAVTDPMQGASIPPPPGLENAPEPWFGETDGRRTAALAFAGALTPFGGPQGGSHTPEWNWHVDCLVPSAGATQVSKMDIIVPDSAESLIEGDGGRTSPIFSGQTIANVVWPAVIVVFGALCTVAWIGLLTWTVVQIL
jgi:hypothetical protein